MSESMCPAAAADGVCDNGAVLQAAALQTPPAHKQLLLLALRPLTADGAAPANACSCSVLTIDLLVNKDRK